MKNLQICDIIFKIDLSDFNFAHYKGVIMIATQKKRGGEHLDANRIIPYIEPIFRFCCKRLSNHYDAEDLASEIICHILDGMNKYQIESLNAWVWQIAHNRYARFIDNRNRNQIVLLCEDKLFDIADYSDADEEFVEKQYETVFRYLHTLSSEYKNIFVDYYIGEMTVRSLAKKYSLPETTIKWRLNVGRRKIRDRIGEDSVKVMFIPSE